MNRTQCLLALQESSKHLQVAKRMPRVYPLVQGTPSCLNLGLSKHYAEEELDSQQTWICAWRFHILWAVGLGRNIHTRGVKAACRVNSAEVMEAPAD